MTTPNSSPYDNDIREKATRRRAAKEAISQTCDTCDKRWTMRCYERKQNNRVPGDGESCGAWKARRG